MILPKTKCQRAVVRFRFVEEIIEAISLAIQVTIEFAIRNL